MVLRLLRVLAVLAGGLAVATGCAANTTPAETSGGVFRVNMQFEPDTIDPGRSNNNLSWGVASQVFEGLFRYDKDLKLAPAVASEVPTRENGGVSEDGRTYTIRLRESHWSDGRPVRAQDFVYAIKRSLDPAFAAPYAQALYDIEGAEAYNTAPGAKTKPSQAGSPQIAALRAAVAVYAADDATLTLRLNAPRSTFVHLLAQPVAWPLREDVLTTFGDKWTAPPNYLGNGPFVLTVWEHGSRIVFEPNPYYAEGKPKLQQLVFVQIGDANQAFLAYRNGELDAVGVPDAAVKQVEADPGLKAEALRVKELFILGLQVNVTQPPLQDVRVRQAFATAIDRQALVAGVAQGVGTPAYSPVPPGMPGHEAAVGQEFTFDAAKARRLLADAGFPDPARFPKVSLTFTETSPNRLRAEFFQAQLRQNLGVQMDLEALDAKAYQQRYATGQFNLALSGWGADYPDPDNFVPELFTTGSGNNRTGYSNPAVDALARDCRSLADEKARMAACAKAQALVVADQPWIFTNYRERFWLVKPYVRGLQPTAKDAVVGSRFYRQLSIAR